jgi:hypothetical protein
MIGINLSQARLAGTVSGSPRTVSRMLGLIAWILALGAPRPVLAQTGGSTVSDSALHFPVAQGRSLTGRHVTLPADFEGDLNVVLVAFKRHQQDDVDTWTPRLRELAAGHPGLRVYELPTLASSYRIMRPFIDGGMRGGIPDSAVRAATITLYINKGPYKAALQIANEDDIHVFLVERGGRIRWRATGPLTDEAAAQLAAALRP